MFSDVATFRCFKLPVITSSRVQSLMSPLSATSFSPRQKHAHHFDKHHEPGNFKIGSDFWTLKKRKYTGFGAIQLNLKKTTQSSRAATQTCTQPTTNSLAAIALHERSCFFTSACITFCFATFVGSCQEDHSWNLIIKDTNTLWLTNMFVMVSWSLDNLFAINHCNQRWNMSCLRTQGSEKDSKSKEAKPALLRVCVCMSLFVCLTLCSLACVFSSRGEWLRWCNACVSIVARVPSLILAGLGTKEFYSIEDKVYKVKPPLHGTCQILLPWHCTPWWCCKRSVQSLCPATAICQTTHWTPSHPFGSNILNSRYIALENPTEQEELHHRQVRLISLHPSGFASHAFPGPSGRSHSRTRTAASISECCEVEWAKPGIANKPCVGLPTNSETARGPSSKKSARNPLATNQNQNWDANSACIQNLRSNHFRINLGPIQGLVGRTGALRVDIIQLLWQAKRLERTTALHNGIAAVCNCCCSIVWTNPNRRTLEMHLHIDIACVYLDSLF